MFMCMRSVVLAIVLPFFLLSNANAVDATIAESGGSLEIKAIVLTNMLGAKDMSEAKESCAKARREWESRHTETLQFTGSRQWETTREDLFLIYTTHWYAEGYIVVDNRPKSSPARETPVFDPFEAPVPQPIQDKPTEKSAEKLLPLVPIKETLLFDPFEAPPLLRGTLVFDPIEALMPPPVQSKPAEKTDKKAGKMGFTIELDYFGFVVRISSPSDKKPD